MMIIEGFRFLRRERERERICIRNSEEAEENLKGSL
jgi:hypothetical protein